LTFAVGAPEHQLQNWGKTENWQFSKLQGGM